MTSHHLEHTKELVVFLTYFFAFLQQEKIVNNPQDPRPRILASCFQLCYLIILKNINIEHHKNNMSDLIVDFPYKRNRRAVHFADKAELYIVARHENNNVARHELWYTKYEYYSMKHDIRDDVQRARSTALQIGPFNYWGNGDDDDTSEESRDCWIGIAHLLTPACMLEVRTCRARCVYAVLAKQASLSPSTRFRWEDIALASFAQTRKAVLRARELGKLHQESI